MMRLLMPVVMRAMNLEKTMGPELRYTIDWDAPRGPWSADSERCVSSD